MICVSPAGTIGLTAGARSPLALILRLCATGGWTPAAGIAGRAMTASVKGSLVAGRGVDAFAALDWSAKAA